MQKINDRIKASNKSITAVIAEISSYGIVKIKFNDTLIKQSNFTRMYLRRALIFKVRDGPSEMIDDKKQNVTNWKIVNFKGK